MRTVLILAMLAAIAVVFDQKWMGQLIFLFILGCALFGFGSTIRDVASGESGFTRAGRKAQLRAHLASLPVGFNPRYAVLRHKGVSHRECVRRGVLPGSTEEDLRARLERHEADYRRFATRMDRIIEADPELIKARAILRKEEA